MATRKSFVELIVPESTIARGANTVGGTVIGDYLVDGHRVVVVKMPKVEKKAPGKKRQKPTTGANSGRLGTPVEAPVAAGVTHA